LPTFFADDWDKKAFPSARAFLRLHVRQPPVGLDTFILPATEIPKKSEGVAKTEPTELGPRRGGVLREHGLCGKARPATLTALAT